jgi:osmotically-inducible protein OsmY
VFDSLGKPTACASGPAADDSQIATRVATSSGKDFSFRESSNPFTPEPLSKTRRYAQMCLPSTEHASGRLNGVHRAQRETANVTTTRRAVSVCSFRMNEESPMTKTDMQLKTDIEEELRWDPTVNAAQIGVSVDKGAVSLLGAVDTYAQKWAAEDATKRVSGVRTVAQDLKVKLLSEHARSDSEIASAVQSALKWDVYVPPSVTANVHDHAVTLEGQVTWNFQRDAAERAVQYLTGVVSVNNAITLEPQAKASLVKEKIQSALQRQATTDLNSIHIDTAGGKVTLTGSASSWQSIEDAANAAWAVPGVTEVVDQVKMLMTY